MNSLQCDKKLGRRRKMPWCSNCGNHGHSARSCTEPTTSCGLVIFKRDLDTHKVVNRKQVSLSTTQDKQNIQYFRLETTPSMQVLETDASSSIKFLLVRRRDSLDYVEFIRGKYDMEDVKYIYHVFSGITKDERAKLATMKFQDLWKGLWQKSSNCSGPDFQIAQERFQRISDGYCTQTGMFLSLEKLLSTTQARYTEPEWGFPKGKRNKRESDLECAIREFQEETGCRDKSFTIIHQMDKLSEIFKGSNNVIYKHVYFIGRANDSNDFKLDKNNEEQMSEIGDMGWYTAKEALAKIRIYDVEKRILLMRLDDILTAFRFTEEEIVTI